MKGHSLPLRWFQVVISTESGVKCVIHPIFPCVLLLPQGYCHVCSEILPQICAGKQKHKLKLVPLSILLSAFMQPTFCPHIPDVTWAPNPNRSTSSAVFSFPQGFLLFYCSDIVVHSLCVFQDFSFLRVVLVVQKWKRKFLSHLTLIKVFSIN